MNGSLQPGRKVPTYRLHKPSGRAVVTLDGTDFYLSKRGSPKIYVAYSRVTGEWAAGHASLHVIQVT